MGPEMHVRTAPLMCTQHSRKPVHNTWYMLQVCLQRKPLQHSPYSKSNWFTEFCKSLCLSQFTASFISVWAQASIAECIGKLNNISGLVYAISCEATVDGMLNNNITPQSCWEVVVTHKTQQTHSIHAHKTNMQMILPQVHLRKPCYDFSFL